MLPQSPLQLSNVSLTLRVEAAHGSEQRLPRPSVTTHEGRNTTSPVRRADREIKRQPANWCRNRPPVQIASSWTSTVPPKQPSKGALRATPEHSMLQPPGSGQSGWHKFLGWNLSKTRRGLMRQRTGAMPLRTKQLFGYSATGEDSEFGLHA